MLIPGKAKLDSAAYVTTVIAKKHRIKLNGMDVLPWPAQSPGLNLIEALWQDVEVEPGQIWGRVSDLEALGAAMKAAWNTISEELLEELIRSMPARLQAVIDADGYPTPY